MCEKKLKPLRPRFAQPRLSGEAERNELLRGRGGNNLKVIDRAIAFAYNEIRKGGRYSCMRFTFTGTGAEKGRLRIT